MMMVNFISEPNHKQPKMDGEGAREGQKMAFHYLTIRLSKWAGSQPLSSFMRNPPNVYKYLCKNIPLCMCLCKGGEDIRHNLQRKALNQQNTQ